MTMKKNLILSALLVLFTGGILVSQTPDKVEQNSQKDKYIKEQSYLSKSSLKDYTGYYGDSLKGFDQAFFEAKYLEIGLHGTEFMYSMNMERRAYVDQKYKLGVYAPFYK